MVTDLPEPVRTAIDAANAGDVDAFLACFNGPSHFTFRLDDDHVDHMTIRA